MNKDLQRIPCFLYEEGVHFALPPALKGLRRVYSRFVLRSEDRRLIPEPTTFRAVNRPEDAQVFLFPLDLGVYTDSGAATDMGRIVGDLPYFAGRERRHICSDAGDRPTTIPQPASIFATSVLRNGPRNVIPTAYVLPEHSRAQEASFDWRAIRYDVSFVGNATHPVRRALITSIRREAPQLRLLVDFDTSVVTGDTVCRHLAQSPEEQQRRQAMFCRSLRTSYCVLCPPGLGPQSIRFYETLHAGRIPVLIDNDSVLPLEKNIDYKAFCCRIPRTHVAHAGQFLASWLAGQTRAALRERCILACRTWNTWFSDARHNAALMRIILQPGEA